MQLAATGWDVIAVDASARRLARLRDNLVRTGFAADVVQGDIRRWQPDALADAVLLDAPCSATGIFRRHPEVLHRIEARQIADMAELQAELLARAAAWVKPGGTPVYATRSRSEEHTSELPATIRTSDAVFCLKKKTNNHHKHY